MVLGGEGDYSVTVNTTEVVEFIRSSDPPSFGGLPTGRASAVGGMLGNATLVCGGYAKVQNDSIFDSCLTFENPQWKESHSMTDRRAGPAGVQINSTTFWILGGMSYNYYWVPLDSTEFIHDGQTKGVLGPTLPYKMNGMCAVKLSAEEIFLIGSHTGHNESVWIFNPQNGFTKRKGPSLITKRICHSCSIMNDGGKTVIVVAGGYNHDSYLSEATDPISSGNNFLDSVEIYDPTDNAWYQGDHYGLIFTFN